MSLNDDSDQDGFSKFTISAFLLFILVFEILIPHAKCNVKHAYHHMPNVHHNNIVAGKQLAKKLLLTPKLIVEFKP